MGNAGSRLPLQPHSDAVEANYRRGDLFGQRMHLMSDWAEFCGSNSALIDHQFV
jgi:hypothetical protein